MNTMETEISKFDLFLAVFIKLNMASTDMWGHEFSVKNVRSAIFENRGKWRD